MILGNSILFDFRIDCAITKWQIVDDMVMGGRSIGHLEITHNGHAVVHGKISLENNGGFSSVRYQFNQKEITNYDKLAIRLKGDGKRYQFRLKSNRENPYSYIHHFPTSGNWQTIEIPLKEMKPFFRGRKLPMPNYDGKVLEEIAFLIANKQAEDFRLEIDKIELE